MTIKIMNLFVLLIAFSHFVIDVKSCHSSLTNSDSEDTRNVFSKDDLALYRSIKKFQQQQERAKRSFNDYYLNVLLVVDQSMVDFYAWDLDSYLTSIMAAVQHRFESALIGGLIRIQVTDILELKNSSKATIDYTNGSTVLGSFCGWKQRTVATQHNGQHDVAWFMTRVPIPDNASNQKSISNNDSCLIVRDVGLGSVNSIVHEMGDVLGAQHDETPFCQLYFDNSATTSKYIMSASPTVDNQWWKWSNCSRYTLTENLSNLRNKCLFALTFNHKDKYVKLNPDHHFLGQHYSLNKQCALVNRSTPYECQSRACERLKCQQFDHPSSYCFPQNVLWADGTDCGTGKWCENGECVQADQKVIHRLKEFLWTHTEAFDHKIASKPARVTATPTVILLMICLHVSVGVAIFVLLTRIQDSKK